MNKQLRTLYRDMIIAMGVEGLNIPVTAVKFFKNGDTIPDKIMEYHPDDLTVTSCQATKQASLGDAVCLTRENIGCIAAAITFGLVDQYDDKPLGKSRVYTDMMRQQSDALNDFIPPSPKDFTSGIVYACKDSNNPDFCLFGHDDSGRFKTVELAQNAISEMMAIQPATMKAVFFCSPEFDEIELEPDIIVLSVRPVELARIIQAYQFTTGKRVTANMGPVRVVNSDLIVRPYLTQEMNISTYCIGARLIAQYEADRMGLGIPFNTFKLIAEAMHASKTGYPFHLYPGADD